MKKLLFNLLFIPTSIISIAQSTAQRENSPTSGCGVVVMIIKNPANFIACPAGKAIFISEANYSPYGLATWQQSIDNGNTWQPINSPHSRSGNYFASDTLTLLSITDSLNNRLYRSVYNQPCSSGVVVPSAPAKLTVVAQPVQVTRHPSDQNVCVGNMVVFDARTSGSSLGFQWQQSVDDGDTFQDITGETKSILTFNNIGLSANNLLYRCIISSTCAAAVTSVAARLTVHPFQVSIQAQPEGKTVCEGNPATLSIAAHGPGIRYQWQKTKDWVNYYNIENENSDTLEIPWVSAGASKGAGYRCLTLSQCNTITSNTVSIYYLPAPSLLPARSVSRCVSDTVHFSAISSIAFPVEQYQYQWQKSTDDGNSYENINGANSNHYPLTILSALENNYKYRCLISDSATECFNGYSNIMTTRVNQPFNLLGQPTDQQVCEKSAATFSVATSGSVSSYQWQVSTDGGNSFSTVFNNYSAVTDRLILPSVSREQNNQLYRCRISSSCENFILFSDTVQLLIDTIPALIADTSVFVSCDTCKTDISNIFSVGNSTSASWSTAHPGEVEQGMYYYSVAVNNGCADKAAVYVSIKKSDTIKTCYRSTEKISAGITGTHYRWQEKVGNYYIDLEDDYKVRGVNSQTLQVYFPGYIPEAYRCVVDDSLYSNTFYIIAANTWNGSVSNDWGNHLNWNCGYVPARYDEVIVPPGVPRLPEVKNDHAIAKMSVFNGAGITILQGIIFSILGFQVH
jgi:hypothetical protein